MRWPDTSDKIRMEKVGLEARGGGGESLIYETHGASQD